MKKLLLFLIAISCFGQNTGQNIVTLTNKQLFGTSSVLMSTNTTVTSGTIQNIGQSSHSLVVNVFGTPVSSMNSIEITASVQGSIDNTNWANIGSPVSFEVLGQGSSVVNNYIASGFQPYPYLRVQLVSSNITNTITANITCAYLGSSTPSHNLIDLISLDSNILTLDAALSYGSSVDLIDATPTTHVVVYGMTINANSGFTSVLIGCGTTGNSVSYISLPSITAGTYVWPSALRPYITCPAGQSLIETGIAMTGSGAISIVYRLE